MFLSRRRLEEMLKDATRAGAEAALEQARREHSGNSTQALTETLEKLITKQFESFAANAGAMGTFLSGVSDLAVKRAAVALGSRGGRKRAENERARKVAREPDTNCDVCDRPMVPHSQAELLRHVNERHDFRRRGSPVDTRQQQLVSEHQEFIRQQSGQGQVPAVLKDAADANRPTSERGN
jgi:tRNA nucleotidyltransferase/poly(A) polymerase